MNSNKKQESFASIPLHVAMIMDGNGRWAKRRGLPRLAGHRAGTENLRQVITTSVEFGIKYLTIYAFSTENWERPQKEVDGLMNIFAEVIDRELDELDNEGVQLRHIGLLDRLKPNLKEKVLKAIERTKDNSRLYLNIAFNYGGRDEIIHAFQEIIKENIAPEEITVQTVSQHLFTAGTPDPDLVIRTSGEMRTSNFLIWQAAYAEWYVTKAFWPDFNKKEYRKAIEDFGNRNRRFGRLSTDDEGDYQ